ncbi:hypothetical protein [Pseudokineococcus lusitanus]|uniref:Uncharacterized protein n=1 Tax=Pseudokineococcus lusitanus TaxID=763993 RepID=A0A3N1HK34_9ACTN|nr:hypothetical protein [Pseudokineococcus lusitanus]ROP42883.1 hypothetical protein EDC03_2171 [Pseudokineococcus lusitanus]
MRRPAVLALALVAASLPAAPAAAAPPEPSDYTVTFPAGRYCDFPLLVESTSKVKVVERGATTVTTSSDEKVTLTNVDDGARTTLRLGGTFRDTLLPDGGTRTISTGRVLIATSATGVTFYAGRSEALRDADGRLVGDIVGSGRTVSVCEQLG